MIIAVLFCCVVICVIGTVGAYVTEKMDERNGYEADPSVDVFDWRMKGIDL